MNVLLVIVGIALRLVLALATVVLVLPVLLVVVVVTILGLVLALCLGLIRAVAVVVMASLRMSGHRGEKLGLWRGTCTTPVNKPMRVRRGANPKHGQSGRGAPQTMVIRRRSGRLRVLR